jgi:hypothetical protein
MPARSPYSSAFSRSPSGVSTIRSIKERMISPASALVSGAFSASVS